MSDIEQENDEEFGAPEEVPVDMNRQINHFMRSTADSFINAHWKVAQHAAEIDQLKVMYTEAQALVEALQQALVAEREYIHKLEGSLERHATVTAVSSPDDLPQVDAIQAMAPAPVSEPAPAE